MIRVDGGWGQIASSVAFSLAFVVSTALVRNTILMIKGDRREFTVEVTGSAKRHVESDRATWKAAIAVKVQKTSEGYIKLDEVAQRLTAYLARKGFAKTEIAWSSVRVEEMYEDRGVKERPRM